MRNSCLFALILCSIFLTFSSAFAQDLPPLPLPDDGITIIGNVCDPNNPESCQNQEPEEEEKNCFKYTCKDKNSRGCRCLTPYTTIVSGRTFGTVFRIDGMLVDLPKKGCDIEFVVSCP